MNLRQLLRQTNLQGVLCGCYNFCFFQKTVTEIYRSLMVPHYALSEFGAPDEANTLFGESYSAVTFFQFFIEFLNKIHGSFMVLNTPCLNLWYLLRPTNPLGNLMWSLQFFLSSKILAEIYTSFIKNLIEENNRSHKTP